jgi:hypothetical protein
MGEIGHNWRYDVETCAGQVDCAQPHPASGPGAIFFCKKGAWPRLRHAPLAGYSLECAPSHRGDLLLCLQPQKNTFLSASAVNFTGAIPVSLWLPSQKGCLADLPQAHQK